MNKNCQGAISMALGERIRLIRLEKEMTQEELGKLLSVGKSTISQYETNKSTPDAATISKIADIFNTTTDYLLGRTNNPSNMVSDRKTQYSPIGFSSKKELEKIITHAVKKALRERVKRKEDD